MNLWGNKNRKQKIIGVAVSSFLAFSVCWAQVEPLPPLPPGPLLLTTVTPEQLSAEYWIRRLPDPDRLLKTFEQIESFNDEIRAMVRDQKNLFEMELVKAGKPVRDQIELEYNATRNRLLYDGDGNRIPRSLFETNIRPLVQWEKVPDRIRIRWGAAVRSTSVRALPSRTKMLEQAGDIEFDQLQFSLIKLWTPVAIYHESSDGEWLYIQAPYIRGWVRTRDIALFEDRNHLARYAKHAAAGTNFLVVTGGRIPIYRDLLLNHRDQTASMGTVLPFDGQHPEAYAIRLPRRGAQGNVLIEKAFVDLKSDVSVGYLPFTQANVIRQAFKLLGSRYGWGGMYDGRDCSAFTHDVFLTFGIDVPRSSKGQGFIGTQLNHFEYKEQTEDKLAALRSATPGITLLRMPKHQMLYLGEVNGRFYAIHSTWAERIAMDSDSKVRINQVVVSDLSLNGRSYLGPLFERIISMNEIN